MLSESTGGKAFALTGFLHSRLKQEHRKLYQPCLHLPGSFHSAAALDINPFSLTITRRSEGAFQEHDSASLPLGETIAIVGVIATVGIAVIAWIIYAYNRTTLPEERSTVFTRAGNWIRNRLSRRQKDPLLSQPTPFLLPESPIPVESIHTPVEGNTTLTRTATWVETARLRAASYHRDNVPVCIALPDLPNQPDAAIKKRSRAYTYSSPNLSVPPSASRNFSSEHLNKLYSSYSGSNIHRQSSMGVVPPIDSFDIGPVPLCPSARSTSMQQPAVLGLGLHVGQSTSWNISSESVDLSAHKVIADLLWQQSQEAQPLSPLSPSEGTEQGSARKRKAEAGDAPGCSHDKGKRRAVGDGASSSQEEQIERYTGPIYADQIASVLSEAHLTPSLSSFASGDEQEHFTDLFKETIALLQDRGQRYSDVDPTLECNESEEQPMAEGYTPTLSEKTIPTALATDQVGQATRQPVTASTLDFHLPLRVVDYNGSRILYCNPRLRSGSLQIVKFQPRRTSLIPGMHISSASVDSDSSSTRHWTEMATSSSQRLFRDELDRFSFPLNPSPAPSSSILKTYTEEEMEIDTAASRQLQHRQRSSSLSMTELLYQQVRSRFSSYTTTSNESEVSRYSQDSTAQEALILSPASPLDISHLRQLVFDINPRIRHETVLPYSHSRTASSTSSTSIDTVYRLGLEDFRLSTFPTVPPLSLRQRILPPTSETVQCDPALSSEITQAMQLNRRTSDGSEDDSDASSSSSSNRDSDTFSPTMVMLELYQDERTSSGTGSNYIEELS